MSRKTARVYEFGPFQLDAADHRLLRDGKPVALTPKAFETLLVLVENRGRLVGKDELMKAVWPDAFVEDAGLTRNISILRRALGRDAAGQDYIETAPKLGYRFIATVAFTGDDGATVVVDQCTVSQTITVEDEEISLQDDVEYDPLSALEVLRSDYAPSRKSFRGPVLAMASGALLVGLVAILYFLASNKARPRVEARIRSIAVLPFRTIAAATDDQHLGLGMADTLITRLSNLRDVVVRPTSVVFKYDGVDQDPVAAGEAMKVDAVLEGSLQRVDDRIRVTVRLVAVQDAVTLWSAKFDETFKDIFTVQDSISGQVAQALSLNVTGIEKKLLTRHNTEDAEAYQLYLKGRYFWNKRTREGYEKAIHYFETAVEKDPTYALPYAGLADAYSLDESSGSEREERYQKAKDAALKALERDDTLAEAHVALAWVNRNYEWDWPAAEGEFKRAIELSPNSADAHQWYALLLTTLGRTEEAITEIEQALELAPTSVSVIGNAGSIFFFARRFDLAMAFSQQVEEMDATAALFNRNIPMIHVQQGMYKDAIAEILKVMTHEGSSFFSGLLGRAYAKTGQRAKAQEVVRYLREKSTSSIGAMFHLASVYGDLGEKDKAFELLRKACGLRDSQMLWIKVDPRIDSLRSDTRFNELLQKMNLALGVQ